MRRIVWTGMACAALLAGDGSSPPKQDWSHYVRIAGHGLRHGSVPSIIAESTASHVFGIEVDNDIPGRYESFLDPDAKLQDIRQAAAAAHQAGNKAFVYIAGLECITAHADKTPHSLFKDHPDWVQRQLDGKPAVFGGGVAFWVAPGDEDVWISPYASAWRTRYMSLVKQIAATGIDGVYVDIPYWMTHFEGWEKSWASFDDYTVAAFKRETGLDARTVRLGDASDPAFRRWIDVRIHTITALMQEIDRNVKTANRHCLTIAEIYPGIEEAVPRVGADVYELYPVVDAIAHEYQGTADSMAASKSPAGFIDQMIGLFAFRAFAGAKPSWMLNYSWDGEQGVSIPESMKTLFAAQLTAGANTWDAKGHVMSGSNDIAVRTEVFAWIARHQATFYDPRDPVDPIGIYFSPETRDYTPEPYVRSFKHMMNAVLEAHAEFQIVTPRTLVQFRGKLLMVPAEDSLSPPELDHLRARGLKLVERDAGSSEVADALTKAPQAHPVRVNAPPLVVAQIARVHGRLHVFLDNFQGIVPKRNPLPEPQTGVEISFDAAAGSKIHVLPFLGENTEIAAHRRGNRLTGTVPAFTRSIVVWCE